jgi:hypothetical protein
MKFNPRFCLFNQATKIRKFLWCLLAQTAVWPLPVIVYPPFFYDRPRLIKAYEPVLVQTLVSHLSVKPFNVSVLHRPAWIYKMQMHFLSHCPGIYCFTGELWAIINHNHMWLSSTFYKTIQHSHYSLLIEVSTSIVKHSLV